MKQFCFILIISFVALISGFSQNIDSILMDDFDEVTRKMDRLMHSFEAENSRLMKADDSLFIINKQLMKRLIEIEVGNAQQTADINNIISEENKQLKSEIQKFNKNTRPKFIVLYILLALALLLLLYLMMIIRISRRESIEYLLAQTDGLSQQNYEIIEKAKDLKKIKKNLKELIKEQKSEDKKKKKKY